MGFRVLNGREALPRLRPTASATPPLIAPIVPTLRRPLGGVKPFGAFKHGGKVKKTGYAKVHKGEVVVASHKKGRKGKTKFRKMARKVLGYGGAQKAMAKPMGGSSMSGMGM